MIGIPFNDFRCLGTITEQIATRVQQRDRELVELAQQFSTTAALVDYIRGLPQRDDYGGRDDTPKVRACSPAQRLRVPAEDPNCVERSALYLGAAELIDPWPVRSLATLDLAFGRHTFPLENGAPVPLEPNTTKEELSHGLATFVPEPDDQPLEDAAPAESQAPHPHPHPHPHPPVVVDVNDAVNYTLQLAREGAASVRNGEGRARLAHHAIRDLVKHGRPLVEPRTVEAVAWLLELARDVARQYGELATTIVHTTSMVIADLTEDLTAYHQRQQRNLSFAIDGHSLTIPSWVSGLGSIVGRIGLDVGAEAIAPGLAGRLAAMGITGKMFDLVKQDLAKDGYNLGPLDKPVDTFTSALNAIHKKRTS